jgi:hypothetical protein
MFPMLAKKFREEKKEETPATSKGKNSMENGSYETRDASRGCRNEDTNESIQKRAHHIMAQSRQLEEKEKKLH